VGFVKVFDFMSDGERPPPIQYLGERSVPRLCRFCGPATPGKFKERKHVLPESLGNKSLFSWEECDDCNQKASKFENDLAVHLTLMRLFSRLPGKASKGRTVQEFAHRFGKDRSKASRSTFTDPIELKLFEGERSLRLRRMEGGFTLAVRVPTYRLVNVAKALVRLAVFVCDATDLPQLAHGIRWLQGNATWPIPLFWQTFIPKTPGQHVGVILQRNVGAPKEAPYVLSFTFAGMILGIAIPGPSWSPPEAINLPNWAMVTPEKVHTDFIQFQGDGLRERPEMSVDIQVPALEGVPPPTEGEIAARAFERYEQRGRSHGSDVDDWLDAEQDLLWEQVGRFERTDADGAS
jgi:hypothetical protein